ncbi:hypothetical protein HU200_012920 [Digitaria exilis]|uniref:Uncharacterized protein n=1 Tax=Digitaria exilis TaxID=1010633 RepID=A0A835KLH1_9POAL|nr:hypothetical protein HU200_012920 [Digitaria exilis]
MRPVLRKNCLAGDAAAEGILRRRSGEKGQFTCLVCEGSGARAGIWGRRFAGCAALVQHARTVAWTKRGLAHRGVCRRRRPAARMGAPTGPLLRRKHVLGAQPLGAWIRFTKTAGPVV